MHRAGQIGMALGWVGSLAAAFYVGWNPPEAPTPAPATPAVRPPPEPDRPAPSTGAIVLAQRAPSGFYYPLHYDVPEKGLTPGLIAEMRALDGRDDTEAYFLRNALANSLDAETLLAALDWMHANPPEGETEFNHTDGHFSWRLGELLGAKVVELAVTHPGLEVNNALLGWFTADPAAAFAWKAQQEGDAKFADLEWPMINWAVANNPAGVRAWVQAETGRLARGEPLLGTEEGLRELTNHLLNATEIHTDYAHTARMLTQVRGDAVQAVLNPEGNTSRGDIRAISNLAVGWYRQDPEAARAFLEGEGQNLPENLQRAYRLNLLALETADNPVQAWTHLPDLLNGQDEEGMEMVLDAIVALPELRASQPEAFYRTLQTLATNEGALSSRIIGSYALYQSDPPTALQDLGELPDTPFRRGIALQVAKGWLESDPETARLQLMYQPVLPIEVQQLLRTGAPTWQVLEAIQILKKQEVE